MFKAFMKSSSIFLVATVFAFSGCSLALRTMVDSASHESTQSVETVKAGQFDTGKMWTFDFPPVDYFKKTYGFTPDKTWFDKARMAALRLPNCTASFVSEDGLLFTNHHCARGSLDLVTKPGEALADDGFYAATLAEERRVPNLIVDQLVLIKDVTDEVQKAFERGKTEDERVANRDRAVADIEKRYRDETKLQCNVMNFYNGGKFSLYGFKRYNDIRLVFSPELPMEYFCGDYDNFTYPRYSLDISFFRVYDDNGQPLKTSNYFRWSPTGAAEGDAVFVIGNPGRTNRLLTYSQIEFLRDFSVPYNFKNFDSMVHLYADFIAKHPEQRLRYQTPLLNTANSQKLYAGRIKGVHDRILMAKKRDFEQTFKQAVLGNPQLKAQYEPIWDEVAALQVEKGKIYGEYQSYTFRGIGISQYFSLASNLIEFANQMKMPEDRRGNQYKGRMLDSLKARFYRPINADFEQEVLTLNLTNIRAGLGTSHAALNKLLAGRTPSAAAAELSKSTILSNKDQVMQLLNGSPDNILQSGDPFISFVVTTAERAREVREKWADLTSKEQGKVQLLGRALFGIYGTSIPPDATFSLRIADGVVKGYEYNGTIAPPFTTFYGMYDRYYSFSKKFPYALPERWVNPPASFSMSTPLDFSSTNDIIGGNSGSPVVNKNLELVGIAFDGNIESLPNDLISNEETMRCVSVHSAGILEALENIYKTDRLAKELRTAKIVN